MRILSFQFKHLISYILFAALIHLFTRTRCLPLSQTKCLTFVPPKQSISDDLMNSFASLLTTTIPPEAVAAQEKSYVTYTLSNLLQEPSSSSPSSPSPPPTDPPTITILESRNLLGGTGTTGFRTWEASLQLSSFLSSPTLPPSLSLRGKSVLELGSGTGYLSICCAKYLGASHVTATDGFDTVMTDLGTNLFINDLQESSFVSTRELKWGHALLGNEDATFLEHHSPDFIIGADVTYDAAALPSLVATFRDLLELFPKAQVVIASTVRNEETYGKFLGLVGKYGFVLEQLGWEATEPEGQRGPFYETVMLVKICRITAAGG
jgi:predicted nicotinamide N-methyase